MGRRSSRANGPGLDGSLSADRDARGRAHRIPEGRGVHVVKHLPCEDSGRTGAVEDPCASRPRQAMGHIGRCRVGIGITVGRQPPGRASFVAECGLRDGRSRDDSRLPDYCWRVARRFTRHDKRSAAQPDHENDQSQRTNGHVVRSPMSVHRPDRMISIIAVGNSGPPASDGPCPSFDGSHKRRHRNELTAGCRNSTLQSCGEPSPWAPPAEWGLRRSAGRP
jgi:hypothetical protein